MSLCFDFDEGAADLPPVPQVLNDVAGIKPSQGCGNATRPGSRQHPAWKTRLTVRDRLPKPGDVIAYYEVPFASRVLSDVARGELPRLWRDDLGEHSVSIVLLEAHAQYVSRADGGSVERQGGVA